MFQTKNSLVLPLILLIAKIFYQLQTKRVFILVKTLFYIIQPALIALQAQSKP